jgi:hypothetical protein
MSVKLGSTDIGLNAEPPFDFPGHWQEYRAATVFTLTRAGSGVDPISDRKGEGTHALATNKLITRRGAD